MDIEQARLAAAMATQRARRADRVAAPAATPRMAAPTLDFEQALPVPAALPADLLAHGGRTCAPRRLRIDAAHGRPRSRAREFLSEHQPRRVRRLSAIGLDELLDERLAAVERRSGDPPAHFRRGPAAGGVPPVRRGTRRGHRQLQRDRVAGRARSRRPGRRGCSSLRPAACRPAARARRRRTGLRPGRAALLRRPRNYRSPSSMPRRRCSPPAGSASSCWPTARPRASRCWSRSAAAFTQEPAR